MKFVRGQIRQGDVALVKVAGDIPPDWHERHNPDGSVTLAHGEVTGHHHSFGRLDRVALYAPDDCALGGAVVAAKPSTLEHQEHAPLVLPASLYIQAVQVEETPNAVTIVED